jgi:hypothetical protein
MKYIPCLSVCVAACVCWAGDDTANEKADLGPLARLVGTWECNVDMDHDGTSEASTTTYRITSGGSALVETMTPDTPHEMVTIYTRDGDDFVLTHYCMAQNQPRMRAINPADGKTFKFDFLDATGMKSPNDAHMRSLVVELVDADHLRQTWSFYENGAKQSDEVFNYARTK